MSIAATSYPLLPIKQLQGCRIKSTTYTPSRLSVKGFQSFSYVEIQHHSRYSVRTKAGGSQEGPQDNSYTKAEDPVTTINQADNSSRSVLSFLCPLLKLVAAKDPSLPRNDTFEVLTSGLASISRLPWGSQALPDVVTVREGRGQLMRLLQLYEFEACPFCRRVREALTELDLPAEVAETRFASNTIVLRRLVAVREALSSMVISQQWNIWRQSSSERATNIRTRILDETWWSRAEYLLSFIEPILSMIRFTDMDKPCLGEVYDGIDSMIENMRSVINAREQDPEETFCKEVQSICVERWNKMTTPLHLLAFALSPKYYSAEILALPTRVPPYRDAEVGEGCRKAIAKLFPNIEMEDVVTSEFVDFVSSTGQTLAAVRDKYRKDAHAWWYLNGHKLPNLQILAIKVLSQVYPCPKGSLIHRDLVRSSGGKEQFPYLVDPNTGVSLYESGDIVKYLFQQYGEGRGPSLGLLESTLFTGWIPTIIRAGRGMTLWESAKPGTAAKRLELFSYENNQNARLVREALCELELPYILHNVGKGSSRTKILLQLAGSEKVPYLIDPNTGLSFGDHKEIISYLFQTYSRI